MHIHGYNRRLKPLPVRPMPQKAKVAGVYQRHAHMILFQVPRMPITPGHHTHRVYLLERVRWVEYDAPKNALRIQYDTHLEELQEPVHSHDDKNTRLKRAFDEIVHVLRHDAKATIQLH